MRAADALGGTVHGPQVWGWHGRTLGHRANHPEHGASWLRLLSVPEQKAGGKLWEGTERAHAALPANPRSTPCTSTPTTGTPTAPN